MHRSFWILNSLKFAISSNQKQYVIFGQLLSFIFYKYLYTSIQTHGIKDMPSVSLANPYKKGAPVYDSKTASSEVLFLDIWKVLRTSTLQLLPGPFWSEMLVPDTVPSTDQIDMFRNY